MFNKLLRKVVFCCLCYTDYTLSQIRRLDELSDLELLGHDSDSQRKLVKELVGDFRLFFWGCNPVF